MLALGVDSFGCTGSNDAGRTVRASVDHLRHGSRLLEELVAAGRVAVVGAEYELETGVVHFFDGIPKL